MGVIARLTLRRLAIGVVLLFVVSLLTFVLVSQIPGDAARSILGPTATPAEIDTLRAQLGLTKPVWSQYGAWLGAALHGDLGNSIISGQPIGPQLLQALQVTLPLAIGAVVVAMLVGGTIGVVAAVRGGWVARTLDVVALIALSVPAFWFAIILSSFFGLTLGILPAVGFTDFSTSPGAWALSFVLPIAAIALNGIAAVAKQTRDSVDEVLRMDFVDALRVQGISARKVMFGHVLRNAAIPVLAVSGTQFVATLGGVVVIESVFALPGLGTLAVTATTNHDLPAVTGAAVAFCVLVILINLVLDVLYGILNPKARRAA